MTAVALDLHLPADAIDRARGWTVVQPLFGHADQLAVVTPAGVLSVVTTRCTSLLGRMRMRRDPAVAAGVARTLRRVLSLPDVPVLPVVMVLGGDVPNGFAMHDDVHVVDGDRPYLWRHRFTAPVLDGLYRPEVVGALYRVCLA